MSLVPRTLSAPVITVLDPEERPRVDAAGAGLYQAIHRDTVADALEDLKHRRVSAVLLSVVRCGRQADRRMAAVVREFPTVPDRRAARRRAGHGGVAPATRERRRDAARRRALARGVASPAPAPRQRGAASRSIGDALAAIRAELGDVTPDCWLFFEALFVSSDRVGDGARARVRHGRAAEHADEPVLPCAAARRRSATSPTRACCAPRRLFADPGHSIADVANALEYSSPQSFGRHVQTVLGMTAGEFRRQYDADRDARAPARGAGAAAPRRTAAHSRRSRCVRG